jgi:cation:H+ antiporter
MAIVGQLVLLAAGLAVLGVGGEVLVRGAANLARGLGVSALLVGLTIVAYGTSAPEAAVSVQATLKGEVDIAVGNIVGSNIANILLILGLGAALRTFNVALNVLKTDGPIMVLVMGVFMLLGLRQHGTGTIGRWEGAALLAGLVAYGWLTYYMARCEPFAVVNEYTAALEKHGSRAFNVLLILVGIVALIVGGQMIVHGAVGVAAHLGIGQAFIGLTIVAVGTSLPELAASIAAIRQNQPDIAIGNIVGSNICNILLVLGLSAVAEPVVVSRETMLQDGPAMLAASVLFLLIVRSGQRVTRGEGVLLLVLYGVYVAWTVVRAFAH